jgi:hypothetical protein
LACLVSNTVLVGYGVVAITVDRFLDAVILARRTALGQQHAPLGAAIGVCVAAKLVVENGTTVLGFDHLLARVPRTTLGCGVVCQFSVMEGGVVVLQLLMRLGAGKQPGWRS